MAYNSTSTDTITITSDRPINGTTYMITGSGAGTRPVNRSEWTALSASKLSFATYEVYADRIEVSRDRYR